MISPEYCLLGIVLNNPELFNNITQNIFLNRKCSELYNILKAEIKVSNGFTKETILKSVRENHILDENDFYEIYDSSLYEDKFDYYFNHVLSEWAVFHADIKIKELRAFKYSSVNDVKQALQDIIKDISIDDDKEIKSSKSIIYDIIMELDKKETPNLIDSHCNYIDSYGGFEAGDLAIIAARPGIGKSSLMYNLLLKDMQENIPCGLFSMEAKEKKVYKIIGCIAAGLDTKIMRTSLFSQSDQEKLSNAYNRIYEKEVLTVDRVNVDIHSLIRKAKIMKDQKNIKKLYIDYLQLITCREGFNRYEQMSNVSRELKKLAMDLDITVIALAQLNRELEKRADGQPKKSDLRDTGSIEQDADIIWLLHMPKVESEDKTNDNETVVLCNIIDKFREGAEGEFTSSFHKPTRRIKEWKQ